MTTILDENRIPAMIAISDADGSTVQSIIGNPANHALGALDGTTGTDKNGDIDPRDENRKIAFFAVSATDGVTPVAVYCDSSTGKLLINSN